MFPTLAVVGVSPIGSLGISVGVSHTETGIFPHWFSAFGCAIRQSAAPVRLPRCQRDALRFLDGLTLSPVVRRSGSICGPISEPKYVRCSVLGITGATAHSDLNKAKRLDFTHRGRDAVTFDAVVFEVAIGDGELAVVVAPVVSMFDLKPVKKSVRR